MDGSEMISIGNTAPPHYIIIFHLGQVPLPGIGSARQIAWSGKLREGYLDHPAGKIGDFHTWLLN